MRQAMDLSTSQAAEHLGVALSTLRRWADEGCLAYYRTPGRQRRFAVADLDAFMAEMRVEAKGKR